MLNGEPGNRYLYLDGWRGLSIIAVLIGHFFPLPGINLGRLGVEMFFVLSGRLMAELLFIKRVELPTFFRRRVSRVWPALFFFICTIWVLSKLFHTQLHISPMVALSSLTFTYNYFRLHIDGIPVFDHIWSLCVEEHIYILLGLTAYLSRKLNWDALLPLGIFTFIFMVNGAIQTLFFDLSYYDVYWRTDTRGASILVAVFVYLILNRHQFLTHWWTAIIFAILGIILNHHKVPDPIKYSAGTICLAISISTINHLPPILLKILISPVITWFGLISFSLYLWQQPLYQLVNGFSPILLSAVAVTLATASYLCIEVPARRFLNARWNPPTI